MTHVSLIHNEARPEQTCIFVSYSSKDREAAEDIEARLQRAGIRVWRDKTRLDADWSREIAEALANEADALCLLWSKDAADSRWVKHEWLTARALEKRIFPCRLNGAPALPSALASLDAIEYSAVSRLVDRIQAAESFHHRYDYTLLPPHTFIPLNPNPEFQGRQTDLLNLYLHMVGNLNKIGINQVGVGGMGGIGKTQLVVEFAYRFSFAFDHIFWLEAADEQRWLEQFVEIARDRLGLRIDNPDGPVTSRQYLLQLQKHCKENPQTLIVMDNVPEPRQLNSAGVLSGMAPLVLGASLLFTTRRRFRLPGVLEQSVDILPPEAAYALLTSVRPPLEADEQQAAKSISDTVGRLPLALALISAYLKDQSMEYSEFVRHLLKKGLGAIDLGEVSAEELATRHKAAVGETIAEDWQVVGDDTALLLCRLAAQFPETAIVPKARLGLLAGRDETNDLVDPLRKAFSRLRDLHLVEVVMGGDAISLHPLIRDFVLGLTPADQQHAMRAGAAGRLFEKLLERDRFERHVMDRGIDAVIHDVETVMTWAPDLEEARGLHRILDRERYPIRRGAPVFQQLNHRAVNMGMLDFADRFADAAHAAGRPFLRSVTTTQVEDPAWIHSFEGHSEGVRDACFSPDGRRALTGSTDKTLILWDVESGQALRSFQGHSATIERVRFSPDGRYALSVSEDQTIVWDGESGQALHALTGPSAAKHAACFSPDSRRAFCSLEDGALVYWDLASRETVRHPTKATWLGAACSSPQGARALSWDKNTLFLWDLDSGELLRSFKEHSAEIAGACLSDDGRRALSFSESAAVLWDLESGRAVRTYDGSLGKTVCLSADGRRALSSYGSPIMLLIDVESEETLGAFDGHSGSITSICFSPDARRALSCSNDKTLILWNLETDQVPRDVSRHIARVTSLCLSHDGRRALSGSRDQTLVSGM